jgi:hypothetical protein
MECALHSYSKQLFSQPLATSSPKPFTIIFLEVHDRDLVFAAGRAMDGPIELTFHAWDLDLFGERQILPYHVRLCLEFIPQHAWSKQTAKKVLNDEALIHHIEEESLDRTYQRSFNCWAFTKDPSRLLQVVFLSLLTPKVDLVRREAVDFCRPWECKKSHVFKVLVHLDVVEDLLLYHTLMLNLLLMDTSHGRSSLGKEACLMGI